MKDIEKLEFDPRVFRRKTGAPDTDGECVVYWMQRSQRATDSPALNVAVDAANLLRKPVVVFFQLLPRAHHANLRHYEFMLQGLEEIGSALRKRHGTSQLSPYLHFGQIGAHAVAIAVKKADAPAVDRKAFLEEFIIRRELAINFVRFNPQYDSFNAGEPWANQTLRNHAKDRRQFLYSERQLENAETHDPLWNAAQKQMVLTGWMHGYPRMYWAKKILEWSPSPAEAFDIAVRLNDRYELDGRDPNGYAGIAWAIVGKHDRAWGPERPVYGKIRYMSYESTSRKFDSRAYIERIAAIEKGRSPA